MEVDGTSVDLPSGATIAAALAELGSGVTRHSVSGEPRAPVCGMGVCHECRIQVNGMQQLGCMVPCASGLQVRTDGAHLQGEVADAGRSVVHACDILVVGAGPAGLQAAAAAAPSGAAIVILEENPHLGGQVWRNGAGASEPVACRGLRETLASHANVSIVKGARVVGLAGDRSLLVESQTRGWVQRFEKLVLCTGARELLLPFPGWTLPGVTGAGGLQALIKQGLDVRGQRIVVSGTGPLLLAAAATAREAGAKIIRVAEQASWSAIAGFAASLGRWPSKAWQAWALLDPTFRANTLVESAQGRDRVESVVTRAAGLARHVACDRLACGFGLVPDTQVAQALGCALDQHGGIIVDDTQRTSVAGVYAAGECTGVGGNERAQLQGRIAGHCVAGLLEGGGRLPAGLRRSLESWERFAARVRRTFALSERVRQLPDAHTVVCRCEDVRYGELARYTNWIDAKLQTRCGMGSCQGRICGAAVNALFGWSPTAPRQLVSPARIATLASVPLQSQ